MKPDILKCNNVSVSYSSDRKILDNISFDIKHGETAILMGRSASGKSTLLKAIAGLINYDGEIKHNCRIMMMFQKPCALPHKTVIANFRYVASLSGASNDFVYELMDRMELFSVKDRYPYQISGGQLQRLSLAACLLVHPKFLMLDEPFSALDYSTRYSMIELLKDIKHRFDLTYFIVTHTLDDIEILGESYYFLDGVPAQIHRFDNIEGLRNNMRRIINDKTKPSV